MRSLFAIAVIVAAGLATDANQQAQAASPRADGSCADGSCSNHRGRAITCRPADYGRPDLFHNYYVNPNCGGVGAQLYTAPGPVPQHVGHTYFTYQPLMPHEFLYQHKRSYHRYYDEGRGFTRTHVKWR